MKKLETWVKSLISSYGSNERSAVCNIYIYVKVLMLVQDAQFSASFP